MNLSEYTNKKMLILGYGKEGKATEQFFKKNVPNIHIGIADKKLDPEYLKKQFAYDIVVKTPGIPKNLVTVPYTTATNIFFALRGVAQIIGVTGSKGKSTTASLIAHILKNAGIPSVLVGNIGVPALSALELSSSEKTVFVYELSSYQLDDIEYCPHISVVTSLFPEHIPYHGSVEAYYDAKKNVLRHAKKHDYYIFNQKYQTLKDWADSFSGISIEYDMTFRQSESQLIGEHNQDNIRAAVAVSRIFKIPEDEMRASIKSFKPLPHRLEYVGMFGGVHFYDDAISTAPESTKMALSSLKNVQTIFLGGEDRGYDFGSLIDVLKKSSIRNIVLFPVSGDRIYSQLQKSRHPFQIFQTSSMEQAVEFAFKKTQKNGICLLSTASPSYSLWDSYVQKGEAFQSAVRSYAKTHTVS